MRSEQSLGVKIWLSLIFTALTILFLLVTFGYQETWGKGTVVVRVHNNQFGVLFTDQGTFKYYEPIRTRRSLGIQLRFWHDTAKELQPMLRIGCHYEIRTIRNLFDSHELGVNRMPPQTTIVKVLRRVEPVESDCDVSKLSGKPVCREDQVLYIKGKGLFPKNSNCDFESFDHASIKEK